MEEKIYIVAICDSPLDCIPDAKHIERNDKLVWELGKFDEIDDFDAAQAAKADGIEEHIRHIS